MKPLNKRPTQIFREITRDITPKIQAIKIDNQPGVMALHIDRLTTNNTGTMFALAHYFTQGGDLCCDPDMTFLDAGELGVFALSFQQALPPIYQEVVSEWNGDGSIGRYRPKLQRDLTAFANTWLANIAEQQGIKPRVRAARRLADDVGCDITTAANILDACPATSEKGNQP